MADIVVTGVTGAVGGRVASTLAERGAEQRLVVRGGAGRAPDLPGAEVAVAAYDDPDALARAFEGAATLLFVSGAEHPDRLEQHRTVARVAGEAGIARVVYTSFLGAAPDCTFTLGRDHFHTEVALREAGMALTALRDAFYQDLLPSFVGDDGVVRGPGGVGRFSPVARADVADVAVEALLDDRWADHALALTGPDLVTMAGVVERVGAIAGRDLAYVDETVDEAYASRRAGWPEAGQFELDAWVSTYTAIADGSQDILSDDVERVLGRPPTDLDTTLRQVT